MQKTQLPLVAICGLLLLLPTPIYTQSKSPGQTQNKFPDAIARSQNAGRIVATLALVPETGFPKELIDKAKAIGVFPRVEKESAMFTQVTQGYGVISARNENGWTPPAFYAFGGGGYGNPFAKNETYGVILLFMTKEALDAFEKGGVPLKNEKKAVAGPVGTITDEQRKELEGAQILAYAYYNGSLKGVDFGKSFWKSFGLNPDNKINKPLYGMKGREVLAGKKVETGSLPAGISAFQEALQKHYGATQQLTPTSK
jgi:lipid-binding SYLF domain-containing protein